MRYSFDRLFFPRSIAVIGANEKQSYAGKTMRNLLGNEYPGEIFPVTPSHPQVFGIPSFPTVSAIGKSVDLAIVIVKADLVLDQVRECIRCGVGGILIISAGFREADPVHGAEREAELLALAQESGVPIIGPNCIGFANVFHSMWACGSAAVPKDSLRRGASAIISQSGAAGFGPLLSIAQDRRVGIKYIVSTGNEAVLNLCDYLEYFLDDPDIRSVSLLIEGFKDARRFAELAIKAKKMGKMIIALKTGESEVGQRAARSHTASLTGDMALFNALVRQYGMIKAEDYEELIELARMTQREDALRKRRLCVVSHSGGIGGYTGDHLGKRGFQVPAFSPETREYIDGYLKGFGSPANPLDLTGQMSSENLADILRAVEEREDVDAFVIASRGKGVKFDNILRGIECLRHPVYYIWTGSMYSTEEIQKLLDRNIPFSFSIQKMAEMMGKMVSAYEAREVPEDDRVPAGAPALPPGSGMLSEPAAKDVLAAAGIPVPARWEIRRREDLPAVWSMLPSGKKAVLKIVSSSSLHKTDMGGVRVGIDSLAALEQAYDSMSGLCRGRNDVEGFMLEEMCPEGLDMVAGIREDPQFGLVLALGLGGIYTELFKLVAIRRLPLGEAEIRRALNEIPGVPQLFAGYRGHPGYDEDALVSAVKRMADMVSASEGRITLLEVNPLRVMEKGGGAAALDCVMERKETVK